MQSRAAPTIGRRGVHIRTESVRMQSCAKGLAEEMRCTTFVQLCNVHGAGRVVVSRVHGSMCWGSAERHAGRGSSILVAEPTNLL